MRRILIIGVVVLLLAAIGALVGAYYSSQQVPDFYRQALAADRQQQQRASTELINRSNRLQRQVKRPGRWQALFSAEQINGYLAVDLDKQFPRLLPPELRDPRVAIGDGQATLACRYEGDRVSTVLSISFEAYLSEPNVVAVRIHGAAAGTLPMPLSEVLAQMSKAAEKLELPLKWRQTDGDPVALITLPTAGQNDHRSMVLDAVELRGGELYLAGKTLRPAGDDSGEDPASTATSRGPTRAVPK
jgi:hypothetical protein